MKKIIFLLIGLSISVYNFAQDEYYFRGLGKLNPAVPTPESFFGFRIGTSLVRYDKVVEYFKLLADKSDRASLQVFGKSWEDREQVKLFVTSPENQRNLESIRQAHLKLIDPDAAADISRQKIIVELAYNVHGGEIAGTDASVLAAYYLVASEDPDIVRRLGEAVILIEPSQNPDGRERAANYINGFHSWPPVADPADREHGSGITPHRGNHFWNDLNRDWLPLSQIESRNRVAFYHKWYPNVYLDYHEMGSESTFYFEPSPLSTWNNILPRSNYEVLNNILAKHFSAALNSIGSLYYTKESFTNLSPIYGSTYPDYEGGVGTTLEIGSTSGVVIETAAGLRTFSKNLRDNFLTSIAAVRAATDEKATFLNYQKEFFKSALQQADKQAVKYIVFGSREDRSLNSLFVNHLLQHQIDVYHLASPLSQDGKTFEPGSAYVVPLRQRQFRVLQSIFEENETNGFDGKTTFYDISAWSTVHGYGIPFAKVKSSVREGAKVTEAPDIKGSVTARSELAYAFDYFDYLAPKALYYLQDNGVKARVAQLPFTVKTASGNKSFVRGTIVIPVAYQTVSPDELFRLLNEAVRLANITVYAVNDGFGISGIDLGSNNIRVLKKPAVAVIAAGNWTSIGELWALLGNTHNIPLVKIDAEAAARVNLSKYTAIILNSGQLSPALNERITAWVENGGTLIALSGAAQWASALLASAPAANTFGGRGRQRGDSAAVAGAQTFAATPDAVSQGRGGDGFGGRLNGIIVRSELNLSHPLTYGFTSKDFYTLKNSTSGLTAAPGNVVLKINEGELVNGYATPESLAELKNKVVIATGNRGSGSVLVFGESPTFRGYWLAPGRILTNALFFGTGGGGRGTILTVNDDCTFIHLPSKGGASY
ncbi:MAG: hypothetical protein LBB73_02510 [Dysgonamonadaceae bacterium]|jgi:hypothetical protein|nr:hypothetical protein [Dysgonamonadaceae bacterium]